MDELDTKINKRKYILGKQGKWIYKDKYLKSLLSEQSKRIKKL